MEINFINLYRDSLKTTISDNGRFFRALEIYGKWPLYEAILLTASRNIKDDPLNYVLSIAHNKYMEQIKEEEYATRYAMRIEMEKERSLEHSQDLANKIAKAKKKREKGE